MPALRDSGVSDDDNINHPPHYNAGKFEVIDVIEDWHLGFHLGNVVKYIARADHKGTRVDDLKKALWYLERAIAADALSGLAAERERVLGDECRTCREYPDYVKNDQPPAFTCTSCGRECAFAEPDVTPDAEPEAISVWDGKCADCPDDVWMGAHASTPAAFTCCTCQRWIIQKDAVV